MKVMVLAGGPDREREVSLASGTQVAGALREAGHEVIERDLLPEDTSALDFYLQWSGEVVFPVFHGRWGEGGGAQQLLEERGVKFVGCREEAARLCADKTATKRRLAQHGLPTPDFELVESNTFPSLKPPVVIKPNDDGSSIDLAICHDRESLEKSWDELATRNPSLLVERYIRGRELTVGVLQQPGERPRALPPIHIIPATAFYDYQAKYVRDDTQYRFDSLTPQAVAAVGELAENVFEVLGCRHLARVDLFLDADDRPWVIEVNTLPGFTTHSLLPMAANHAGIAMPQLVDRLARWGASS